MCTSTRTTSGLRSRISSIAASTSDALADHDELVTQLGAHPGQEELVVVDEEDPERVAAHGLPRHHELDLGALARAATHGGAAAVARHTALDRFGDAAPVGGDRRAIEALSPIADEHGRRRRRSTSQ